MLDASKKKISVLVADLKEKVKTLPEQYSVIREKMQDLTQTNTDLGFMHLYRGNLSDAVMRFKMVLRWFHQDYPPALYGLGCCRKEEGDYEEAATLLKRAIALRQGNYPEAEYVLAKIDSSTIPTEIPSEILFQYFEAIAPDFNEEFLGNRHYRGPDMLLEAVTTVLKDKTDVTVLDLGCGTGLCGKEFKEHKVAKEVTGVDISNAMLRQAQSLKFNYRPVYDNILLQDYLTYLDTTPPDKKFDVILAATAFHYQRDLAKILTACRKVLQPGGLIAFTLCKSNHKDVEFLPQIDSYAFSLAHLETQAKTAQLTSVIMKEGLIYDGCPGYVCAFVNR